MLAVEPSEDPGAGEGVTELVDQLSHDPDPSLVVTRRDRPVGSEPPL